MVSLLENSLMEDKRKVKVQREHAHQNPKRHIHQSVSEEGGSVLCLKILP